MPERAFLCRFWTFVSLHQKQKTKGMEHQKTSYEHVAGTDRLSDSGNIRDKKHSDKQNRKKGRNPQIFK